MECETHKDERDQMKVCAVCEYAAQGYGDFVRDIVHRTDGPGRVLPPRCHRLLPEGERRVLSFADNRQEAAYFAVFAENSYRDIVDHNAMLRALRGSLVEEGGICVDDLFQRLVGLWEREGLGGEGSGEALRRFARGGRRESQTVAFGRWAG